MACSLSLYITGLYVLMLAPVFIEIFSGSASFPPNHSASAIYHGLSSAVLNKITKYNPDRSLAVLPKRGVSVSACEVAVAAQ